uniref:Uncharacterized protein n=1 Tax=Anguilla anguilla TaxID=7936 RepID=A0A0E9XKV2_ANGAN
MWSTVSTNYFKHCKVFCFQLIYR